LLEFETVFDVTILSSVREQFVTKAESPDGMIFSGTGSDIVI